MHSIAIRTHLHRAATHWLHMLTCLFLTFSALPVLASPSFTTSLSWYQGFDLTEGVKEIAPNVVTIVFGPQGTEIVPDIAAISTLSFTPATNFYFAFNADAPQQIALVPHAVAGLAVLPSTPFDAVGDTLPANLDFGNTPEPVALGPDDTVLLLTTDDAYFKIGHIAPQPDLAAIAMTYQRLERQSSIPEPATLGLLSLGLLGIGLLHKFSEHS